jgi:RNA polymerase sigma factor (sigma-70 family)
VGQTPAAPPTRGATDQDIAAHAASLRRLARRLVGDAAADDLVQETWTAALRSPPSRQLPLLPWLAQVLRNFARMGRRHRRLVTARADDVQATAHPGGPLAGATDDLLERLEANRLLVEELARLPEPYRTTLLLRYFEEVPAARIARMQGVPAGTVRWRLKRGIELMRAALDARAGGRGRWMFALLPLPAAGQAGEAGLAGALEGGIILSTKTKLGLSGAALLLALATVAWLSWQPAGSGAAAEQGGTGPPAAHGPRVTPVRWAGEGAGEQAGAPPSTGAIDAVVLGPEGAPLPGASVTLSRGTGLEGTAASDVPRPHAAGVSDAEGRVRFTGLAVGRYALTATLARAGLAPALLEGVELSAGQARAVRLLLGRGGLLLTGLVRESGAGAVAGARVTAALAEREGEPGAAPLLLSTTTAGDGGYALLLAAGRYVLRAEADGYATASDVVAVMAADVRRDLRLEPAASIAGHVVERATRQPVPGAAVQARLVEGWSFGRSPPVTTDAQGGFRLTGLGPGDFMLEARAGARAGRTPRLRLRPGEALAEVVVELDTGFVLAGRVLATSSCS